MLNPVFKSGYKAAPIALEYHVAPGHPGLDLCQRLQGHTVDGQVFFILHQPPDQMISRDTQGFPDIDDGMGHDDTALPNGQQCIGVPPQKTVETDKYILAQVGIDNIRPVSGDIIPLQPGIDDVAIFLGIGALAQPGVLKIRALPAG